MVTKRCTCGVTLPMLPTAASGKLMMVEPKEGGNIVLQETLTGETEVHVVQPGAGTHQAHFVSCPDADLHRRRGATLPTTDQGAEE